MATARIPLVAALVQGSGFRAQGSGFGAQGSGFRVQGSGFGVQGSGFRVHDSEFRVQGSGFRVQTCLILQVIDFSQTHLISRRFDPGKFES